MPRLSAGDKAPVFTLISDRGEQVASDFQGHRTIVWFYPAALTPACTTEACDFSESLAPFTSAGYRLLGISPDTPEVLAEFREQEHLDVTLLSDPDKKVHRAYDVYGEKQLYGKTVVGVIRSTFVVGPDGRIERAWYAAKATGHVARLRRDLNV